MRYQQEVRLSYWNFLLVYIDARLGTFLTQDPLWAEVYAPNGTLLKEGDIAYRKVRFGFAITFLKSLNPSVALR